MGRIKQMGEGARGQIHQGNWKQADIYGLVMPMALPQRKMTQRGVMNFPTPPTRFPHRNCRIDTTFFEFPLLFNAELPIFTA